MVANVQYLDPATIRPNKDNPRLIFRSDELDALEKSIESQGILVPLTIFKDGSKYTLLDGERRWRCARKLNLRRVPVIIQEKPDRLTNIMMMFAIHNARKDWDPLPTALKLQELEAELTKGHGRAPTEAALAAAASIPRGEVRRLRKVLRIPNDLQKVLLEELKKPRHEQMLKVDQVVETIAGVNQLLKRGLVSERRAPRLVRAIVKKFRRGAISNTTEPRLLSRIARSFARQEVAADIVADGLRQLVLVANYSIEDLFRDTVEQLDFEHSTEQLADRLAERVQDVLSRKRIRSRTLIDALGKLRRILESALR